MYIYIPICPLFLLLYIYICVYMYECMYIYIHIYLYVNAGAMFQSGFKKALYNINYICRKLSHCKQNQTNGMKK